MKPQYLILHHSKTKDQQVVDWQAIRRYHKGWAYNGKIIDHEEARELTLKGKKVKRPWTDIGYHYGIEMVRGEFEVLVGRFANKSGAHCYQERMNHKSLGILLMGDFDNHVPDIEQWGLAVDLCASLCAVHGIPVENVKGHRDFATYKSCPGHSFDMDKFREQVKYNLTKR